MKIVECVPNFSEGKKEKTFYEIKNAIAGTKGVMLLNLEPDSDYNRVVVTMAGDENGIAEAAVNASLAAARNIDMRNHQGEHPRLGAIDVVPFIPVRNITMEQCVGISEKFAEVISEKLDVPVFLYENSARNPERKNLSEIRKGEYEGLSEKLKLPEWKPDYGKAVFNPKLGAIITGARFFLIAYNVNIKTTDITIAKTIAEVIRESGGPQRDDQGNVIKVDGKPVKVQGRLKAVKAMGVSLEKFNITQVSMNLTNYNITPVHTAFEEVRKEAERLGAEVTGSEIVGLVPLEAMIKAGRYYSRNDSLPEERYVELAVEKLRLNNLSPFKKEEKIIDYML